MTVEDGEVAVLHYVGRLAETDEVFDTSDVDVALESGAYHPRRDYVPLSVEVGAGEVPPAIENAVREMSPGEERTVTLGPEEAFGERESARVVTVDRERLESESGRDARPWRLVGTETGETGWITDVGETSVTVDFNPDLAGERLRYELRLLEVREPEA